MNLVDIVRRIRGTRVLRRQRWLWAAVGVPYRVLLRALSRRRGIAREVAGEKFRWRYPFSEFDRDFEQPVQEVFWQLSRPGMTILDIGASFGLYSVVAARKVEGGGRVYAFEPLPEMAAVLRDHVALNDVGNSVEVIPQVVDETSGEVELWEPVRDRLASISRLAASTRLEGEDALLRRHVVSATSIDEFCEERQIAPDLIKIDVEGAEANVLRGGRKFLERRSGHVILEVHPSALESFGESTDGVLSYLEDAGWGPRELYRRGDDGDPAATIHYVCEPGTT